VKKYFPRSCILWAKFVLKSRQTFMEVVGEFVQEAVDFMNSGAYLRAVAPTAQAIEATLKKSLEKENLSEDDYKRFIKQNWHLSIFYKPFKEKRFCRARVS